MPVELLVTCHERLLDKLALLRRLQSHLTRKEPDKQAREAAVNILRYFDLAAPLHHQDEELHIFPAVKKVADHQMQQLLRRLLADHRTFRRLWRDLRSRLRELATTQNPVLLPLGLVTAFCDLHVQHIQLEESIVFPAALRHVDSIALVEMAADMMQRRGLQRTKAIGRPPKVGIDSIHP